MNNAIAALLFLFAQLSMLDGVYLHLVKYKLHRRRESWREHVWHTARAFLFLPILLSIFAVQSGGILLWVGLGFILIDQIVEVLDIASEKGSRDSLGGLSSFEYGLHVLLTTVRTSALALSLATRPPRAWLLSAPNVLHSHDGILGTVVQQLIPGVVVIALVHLWLAVRYRPREVLA